MSDLTERLEANIAQARRAGYGEMFVSDMEEAIARIDALTEALREIHRLAPRGGLNAPEANRRLDRVNRLAAAVVGEDTDE